MIVATPEQTDLIPWAKAVDQNPPTDWQHTLDRLKEAFRGRYSIKRLPSCWMAFDTDPNTLTEPTIIKDTAEEFVRNLLDPGPRYGKY